MTRTFRVIETETQPLGCVRDFEIENFVPHFVTATSGGQSGREGWGMRACDAAPESLGRERHEKGRHARRRPGAHLISASKKPAVDIERSNALIY